jgi:hypothetical protein
MGSLHGHIKCSRIAQGKCGCFENNSVAGLLVTWVFFGIVATAISCHNQETETFPEDIANNDPSLKPAVHQNARHVDSDCSALGAQAVNWTRVFAGRCGHNGEGGVHFEFM